MFVFIILIALILRLIIAATFFGPWDTESVYVVSDLLQKGSLVYNETWRHNNPPTLLWIIGSLSWVANTTHIPLSFLFKIPFILADIGLGILIYKILRSERKAVKTAIFLSSLFLLNPLPILISSYQGQLDSLFLFFTLLSSFILSRAGKITFKTVVFSSFFLGIACTIKLIPLALLPLFLLYLLRSDKISGDIYLKKTLYICTFTLMIFLPLILEFIPYLSVWDGIVLHVFRYQTAWSLWGVSLVLRKLQEIFFPTSSFFAQIIAVSKIQSLSIFSVVLISYLVILFNKWSLTKSVLFIFLIEYAVSSYLAPQYLVWILPFFILEYLKKGLFFYSFTAYSLLTFFGASTIYLFWQDQTLFQILATCLKISDVPGFAFNLYALQMFFPWLITLWWFKKIITD